MIMKLIKSTFGALVRILIAFVVEFVAVVRVMVMIRNTAEVMY